MSSGGQKSPSRSRDEAEEFLLNLTVFLHFPELNTTFYTILSLTSKTTLINFVTPLTRRHID